MGQGRIVIVDVPWVPSMGIHYLLAADGISRVLVLLTGLAAVAGVLFSWNIELRTNEFFAFFLALIGGVYGVFLSFDLFLLFVFYEIAIVPKYFLIAIWGSTRREYAAMKLALYSFVGSAMVLIGLLAAYATAGSHSTSLIALGHAKLPVSFQMWCFPLVFAGFAILAGMWPFHTWAPTGHVAAPTAASMLLAGVVMKLGAYGCLRVGIGLFPHGLDPWGFSIHRHRLVARCVRGAGGDRHCLRRAGGAGADRLQICHWLLERQSHGVCAAGADDAEPDWRDRRGVADVLARHYCRAAVRHCGPHRLRAHAHAAACASLEQMHLAKRLPFAAWAFVIAGMASMGLPGFSGFVAELQVLVGAWSVEALVDGCGGRGHRGGRGVYVARAAEGIFQRCAADRARCWSRSTRIRWRPITWPEITGVVLLAGVSLFVGLYPRILLDAIEPAVKALLAGGGQ